MLEPNPAQTDKETAIIEAHKFVKDQVASSIFTNLDKALASKSFLMNDGAVPSLSLVAPDARRLSKTEKMLTRIPDCKVFKVSDGYYLTSQTNSNGVELMYLVSADREGILKDSLPIVGIFTKAPIEATEDKIIDLSRVFPPSYQLSLKPNGYMNRRIVGTEKIELIPMIGPEGIGKSHLSQNRGEVQVETILHEAGHAWEAHLNLLNINPLDRFSLFIPNAVQAFHPNDYNQYSNRFDSSFFHDALKKLGKEERTPSAIALLFYRMYASHNIQLTPGIKNVKDLFEIYEKDLYTYETRKYGAIPLKPKQPGFASRWYRRERREGKEV